MAAKLQVEDVILRVFEDYSCQDNQEVDQPQEEEQSTTQEQLVKPVISRVLYGSNINTGILYNQESLLWLRGIYRRLAGRRSIRRPYYSEIIRHIPVEMYLVLTQTLRQDKSPMFSEPKCYIAENKKGMVVSFTAFESVLLFLRLLAKGEVLGYLKRTLTGKRKDHITRLIVSPTKDFALTYSFRKGVLIVSFNFGEWNPMGFHNTAVTYVSRLYYLVT